MIKSDPLRLGRRLENLRIVREHEGDLTSLLRTLQTKWVDLPSLVSSSLGRTASFLICTPFNDGRPLNRPDRLSCGNLHFQRGPPLLELFMILQKPSFVVNDYRGRQYSIVEIVTIVDDDRKGEIETSSTLMTTRGDRVQAGKTTGEYWIHGIGATRTVASNCGFSIPLVSA